MTMTMTRRDGAEIQSTGNERAHRGDGKGPLTLSALVLTAMLAGGCGGGGSSVPGSDAGTTTPDGATATAIGTIVRGTSQPCTEPHSICVNAKFPASVTVQPKKLQIDFYVDIPPSHPPDGIPLAIPTPGLEAGETVQLRMTDIGMTGSYHFLGLLYMPGGGDFFPVSGVDYIGDSSVAYALTEEALNLPETLDFHYLQ